jgi:hypothetical protein
MAFGSSRHYPDKPKVFREPAGSKWENPYGTFARQKFV